jgi:hypothetical protein
LITRDGYEVMNPALQYSADLEQAITKAKTKSKALPARLPYGVKALPIRPRNASLREGAILYIY